MKAEVLPTLPNSANIKNSVPTGIRSEIIVWE